MNYVFFFPDEMRAESVACYGNEVVKTPNLDMFAKEGVLFEQCHVQNPVCSPSRCSLFTGLYPHVSGHRTLWHLIRPHEPNLFKYLKDAGYQIHIFGKNDLLSPESKKLYTDTFEFRRAKKPLFANNKYKYGEDGYYSFLYEPIESPVEQNTDYCNVQAGIDFLRSFKKGDKPFMLFLPLLSPHCPYSTHTEYYNMYDLDKMPELRPDVENKPGFQKLIKQYRSIEKDKALLKKIQAVYLGMISFSDFLFGEVLKAIDECNLRDDTMVIMSSDHGDWAGDYGLVEKWPNAMDDTLTRVPLIIRSPDCKAGHRVSEQVELFDIMPTILETANIECSHTHFARSLVPQLNGMPGDKDRAVFCEGGYDIHEPHSFEGFPGRRDNLMNPEGIYYPKALQQQEFPDSVCRTTMMRTSDYKIILRTNGENELYDLKKDPYELDNLYNIESYDQVRSNLEKRLLNWYLKTSDVVPANDDPR